MSMWGSDQPGHLQLLMFRKPDPFPGVPISETAAAIDQITGTFCRLVFYFWILGLFGIALALLSGTGSTVRWRSDKTCALARELYCPR